MTQRWYSSRKFFSWILYLVQIPLSLLLLRLFSDILTDTLDRPVGYGGDSLWTLATIKAMIEGDWIPGLQVPISFRMGFPFVYRMTDFPTADLIPFWIMKLLSLGTSSPYLVCNLYYVLTFILTALLFYWLTRKLRISPWIGIPLAQVYTLLPFHFHRFGHLFIGSYFLLPMGTWMILRLSRTDVGDLLTSRPKAWLFYLTAFLLAMCGVYYAFYFALLLFCFSILVSIESKSWVQLKVGILGSLCTFLGLVFCILPFKYSEIIFGRNGDVVRRFPSEAEIYGLRPIQLVLPVANHVLEIFRKIRNKYPIHHVEGSAESFGTLLAIAFVLTALFPLLRTLRFKKIHMLGALLSFGVGFAMIGGGSSLFSYYVQPSFRCGNRISIFLACFSLLSLAIFSHTVYRKYRKPWMFRGLFLCVVGFALVDIRGTGYPFTASSRAETDLQWITQIEKIVPPGSGVLQLPYMAFPENGPIYEMDDYDHFRGFMGSSSLKWSYGIPRHSGEDTFVQTLSQELMTDPQYAISRLKEVGFSGIWIQLPGYPGYKDAGKEVLATLSKIPGIQQYTPPIQESHGRPIASTNVFFSILNVPMKGSPQRKEWDTYPLVVEFKNGFFQSESEQKVKWQWDLPQGRLTVTNYGKSPQSVEFKVSVDPNPVQENELSLPDYKNEIQCKRSDPSAPFLCVGQIGPGRHKLSFQKRSRFFWLFPRSKNQNLKTYHLLSFKRVLSKLGVRPE